MKRKKKHKTPIQRHLELEKELVELMGAATIYLRHITPGSMEGYLDDYEYKRKNDRNAYPGKKTKYCTGADNNDVTCDPGSNRLFQIKRERRRKMSFFLAGFIAALLGMGMGYIITRKGGDK